MKLTKLLQKSTLALVFAFQFANAQTLLRNFTFDNTFYDAGNNDYLDQYLMAGGSLGYYTTGRNGVANTAYHFGYRELRYVSISTSMPIGNTARTVAVWVKFNVNSPFNYIFSHGTATNGGCFGLSNRSSTQLEQYSWGTGNSVFFNPTTPFDLTSWYHLVTVYDGTNVKMYVNGTLAISQAKAINTQGGYFYVGGTPQFNANLFGDIDDIQIYSGALSDAQIANLYANNTLSTSDFNQNNLKVVLYPNPVRDMLNIEIENEIKSVEIYSLQGQKVFTTKENEFDISSLETGVYMLRVEDALGNVATQKLVKQ